MQAIRAIYDGTNFMPRQPIPVKGQYEVVITFVEQITVDAQDNVSATINEDINFWQKFDKLAVESIDEELSVGDFPRAKFNREFVLFEDDDAI